MGLVSHCIVQKMHTISTNICSVPIERLGFQEDEKRARERREEEVKRWERRKRCYC